MSDDFSGDINTTGTVAVGGSAMGNIETAGERDWFAVELVAGRTYTIDLRGRPTEDGTLSDPYLRGIHDANGNLVARTTNDDGGEDYNSRVTFTATETGTHYIAAGAWGGNRGTYELEVTDNSPADTASPPDTTSAPEDEDFSADTSTGGQVAVGGTATGEIGSGGERDWFAVELVAGRTYTIDLRGRPTEDGTLSDPYLRGIHDANGNLIARTTNDDGGEDYNSRVTFTATETGTHYLAAGAWGGNRGTYELEVTDNSPADTASPPDTTTDATTDTTTDTTPRTPTPRARARPILATSPRSRAPAFRGGRWTAPPTGPTTTGSP